MQEWNSCEQLGLSQRRPRDSGAVTANSGVADALKAMGTDIANKMEEFGQRLALLESRSAGPSADHHSFDTSAPRAPEVRKDGITTPAPNIQPLPWAERPVDEVPDYNLQLSWDDEEPGDESTTTSNLFSMSENTGLANCFKILSRRQSPTLLANSCGRSMGTQDVRQRGCPSSTRWSGTGCPKKQSS